MVSCIIVKQQCQQQWPERLHYHVIFSFMDISYQMLYNICTPLCVGPILLYHSHWLKDAQNKYNVFEKYLTSNMCCEHTPCISVFVGELLNYKLINSI